MFGKYIRYLVVTLVVLILTATPALAQAPTVTLTADRTTVSPGQCTNLNLRIQGKWAYILSPDNNRNISNQNNSTDYSVSWRVCPASTTTYNIVVSGSAGQQRPSITINVSAPQQQPPSQPNQFSFTADQTTVNSGQCTTLHWHTVNGVFVNFNNAESWELVPGFDNPQVTNGSQQVCPTSTTTYNLYARFADGSRQSQSVTVNVSAPPPPSQQQQQSQPQQPQPIQPPAAGNVPLSVNFYANPDTINAGQCTTLYWHVVGNNPAEKPGASIGPPTEDYGSVAPVPDGSGKVCPNSTTTYTLYGDDVNGNPWERKVTVTVLYPNNPPQPQIQPQPVQPPITSSGAMLDLGSYCAYKYGRSASAKMGDRLDAWSWSCSTPNQSYGIDMSDVCAVQHPDLPKAVMLDRQDAYSWICIGVPALPTLATLTPIPFRVQLATLTPIPFRVQVEEPLITKRMGWLSGTYQFTKADSEALTNLLATYPDAKGCLALLDLALSGGVTNIGDIGSGVMAPDFKAIVNVPGDVKDCQNALTQTDNILDKYIHKRFEWSNGAYVPANVEWYCLEQFNASVVVPKWDNPFGWTCRDAGGKSIEILTTQMNELCQMEYPDDFPNAYLRDEGDAFSWVCRQ